MLPLLLATGALASDQVAALSDGDVVTLLQSGHPVRSDRAGSRRELALPEHISVMAAAPGREGFALAGLSTVLWCPHDGRCQRVGTEGAHELAVSPSGDALLLAGAERTTVFDLQHPDTPRDAWRLPCSPTAAALTDEGVGLVACGRRGSGVWRLVDGQTPAPMAVGKVSHMALTPTSDVVAMAGTELTVWDTSTWALLDSEPRPARDVIWTDDGQTLLFATVDGVRAWPRGGQPGPLMPADDPRLAIDADGRVVLSTLSGLTTLEPG